jgi:hypothetical protein
VEQWQLGRCIDGGDRYSSGKVKKVVGRKEKGKLGHACIMQCLVLFMNLSI